MKYIVTGGNGSSLFSVDQLSGRCSLVALTLFKNFVLTLWLQRNKFLKQKKGCANKKNPYQTAPEGQYWYALFSKLFSITRIDLSRLPSGRIHFRHSALKGKQRSPIKHIA